MRRFATSILCLVIVLLTLGQPSQAQGSLGKPDDLTVTDAEIAAAEAALGDSSVGILACTLDTEYHSAVTLGAAIQFEKYGLKSQVLDAQVKADQEVSIIQGFVQLGIKALIVCDLDPKVVLPAIEEAIKSGVVVVEYAGRTLAPAGATTISIEDTDLGTAAGEYAGQLITKELGGKARVAILDYPALPSVVARADAIEKALRKEAPDAEIVGRFLGGTPDNGQKSIEDLFQTKPYVNVIVSINDAGALGALKALINAGKLPREVIVVGIDAEKEAKQNILDGYFFRATVDTSPDVTGVMSAQAVVKLLAKSKFPQNIVVPVTLVTKESLQNVKPAATKAIGNATLPATAAATSAATESK
jgi:ribose transport system substrate-binding protein